MTRESWREAVALGPVRPLVGYRVLDVSHLVAGPFCAMVLGLLGADVIKVEPPSGDPGRRLSSAFLGGEGVTFLSVNRGKRGIAIDRKHPAGRDLFLKLVETADILIESFRPGVAERLGIAYDQLVERRPELIYCSITGFGERGPARERPGTDFAPQAASGLMSVTGEPGRPPVKVGALVADISTGLTAVVEVLAAVLTRVRGGPPGQRLTTSVLGGALTLQLVGLTEYLISGRLPARTGSRSLQGAPAQVFATASGEIVLIAASERMWADLCRCIGRPQLADDPRFRTNADRLVNHEALAAILEEALRAKPAEYWLEVFSRAGVICYPVRTYDQVVNDPQVKANGHLAEVTHPALGRYRTINPAISLEGVPPECDRPPPLLGEHTEDILRELGLTEADIELLRNRRVVVCGR